MSGDEQAYGEQVASLTILDGGIVLRKRGDGFVKLRYTETPPILSARYGESWGRSLETTPARVTPLEVIDGRKKDCEGRELGVTNRDYVFDFERDGDQLDELLDSLDEKWGES